jgi:deoxyribodipyrimidine photo-lyase
VEDSERNLLKGGVIVYWMRRDQRVDDNWALLYALDLCRKTGCRLQLVFCLNPQYLYFNIRHYYFLIEGLKEVEKRCFRLKIPFTVLPGKACDVLFAYIQNTKNCSAIVTDFMPLHPNVHDINMLVGDIIKHNVNFPTPALFEVDAHNVVPVWCASNKKEIGARTIRSKLHKLLPRFFTEFPLLDNYILSALGAKTGSNSKFWPQQILNNHTLEHSTIIEPHWPACMKLLDQRLPDSFPGFVSQMHAIPGSRAAHLKLNLFLHNIQNYSMRNDPVMNCTSGLSAYLNFGQISAQRCAIAACQLYKSNPTLLTHSNDGLHWGDQLLCSYKNTQFSCKQQNSKVSSVSQPSFSDLTTNVNGFIEQLIVRKELSDNFVFYEPSSYDSLAAAAVWAKDTLAMHSLDPRVHIYTQKQLEYALTEDRLWNASQIQMIRDGKMHGFLRMYWCKKILEWSPNAEVALQTAIMLNDKYNIDGNDANG